MPNRISNKTVGRLSLYCRALNNLLLDGTEYIFSHDLAKATGVSAAQVRRDVMAVGYSGSPVKGYEVSVLAQSIEDFLTGAESVKVALVGLGNIGRAMLSYFLGRRKNLSIVAAFDREPSRVDRVINGCHSYPMADLPAKVKELEISTGIIAVPPDSAQEVADQLISSGVRGLLNFAPASLRVPPRVYVENVDVTVLLEKVAFFARQNGENNR